MSPPSFEQLWPEVRPLTLLHEYKAKLVYDALAASPSRGDAVECGVFRGGVVVMMAREISDQGRRIVAYDSFMGLPDDRSPAETEHYRPGHMVHSEEAFRNTLRDRGVDHLVDVVPGWFADTMREKYPRDLSFAHVDCDMYHGVKVCIDHLYASLLPGGVMVFDDYLDQGGGVQTAVDDLLAETDEILHAGYTDQVFVVKGQTWRRRRGEPTWREPRCGLVVTTADGIPVEASVPALDDDYQRDLLAGKLTGELPGGTLLNARRVADRIVAQCEFHEAVLAKRAEARS